MTLKDSITSFIYTIHPFMWFVAAVIIAVGYSWYIAGQLTEGRKQLLGLIAIIGFYLAYKMQGKRLIGLQKAKDIAYKETIRMQNRGELLTGALRNYPEAKLWEIEGQPQNYIVAAIIDNPKPTIVVYFVHPYEVPEHLQVEAHRVVEDYFTVEQIPDLRFLVPNDVISYLQQKAALEKKYGTEL